jgi:hypothetical protein
LGRYTAIGLKASFEMSKSTLTEIFDELNVVLEYLSDIDDIPDEIYKAQVNAMNKITAMLESN